MPARDAPVQSKTLTDPFAAVIGRPLAYIMRSSAPPME